MTRLFSVFMASWFFLVAAMAQADSDMQTEQPYVFAWPFVQSDMSPRGGTTEGPSVQVVTETTDDFQRIHAEHISKWERDRRAILAMAGSYRVSFDFMELIGYAPDFAPSKPYRSWGTEHVYVVENTPAKIVLQHILIMTIVGEDGELMGPFVTKHWRQDWSYQDAAIHTYSGHGSWEKTRREEKARSGTWSQTVWQVDDSPRYAAWGKWQHTPERSWWSSEETWRPLPRREFSVRDDYDVMIGSNTHIVLPTGWVQEEQNVKAVLDDTDKVQSRLAREIGIARYQRISDLDTTPGDDYWNSTADFWAEVRAYWDREMAIYPRIALKAEVDGRKLFQPLFERAQAIADGEAFSKEDNQSFISDTINAYRVAEDAGKAEY